MRDYTVLTDLPFVAGQRSPGKGKTIRLSEEQARYPLLNGEVAEPETEGKAEAKSEPEPKPQPKPTRHKAD